MEQYTSPTQSPMNQPAKPHHTWGKSIIIIVSLILVAILCAIVWVGLKGNFSLLDTKETETSSSSKPVTFTTIDLSKVNPEEKIPSTFPSDFPVVSSEVIYSGETVLNEKNITYKTVVFEPAKNPEDVLSEFKSFFEKGGYELQEFSVETVPYVIEGTKDGQGFQVSIFEDKEKTKVSVMQILK